MSFLVKNRFFLYRGSMVSAQLYYFQNNGQRPEKVAETSKKRIKINIAKTSKIFQNIIYF